MGFGLSPDAAGDPRTHRPAGLDTSPRPPRLTSPHRLRGNNSGDFLCTYSVNVNFLCQCEFLCILSTHTAPWMIILDDLHPSSKGLVEFLDEKTIIHHVHPPSHCAYVHGRLWTYRAASTFRHTTIHQTMHIPGACSRFPHLPIGGTSSIGWLKMKCSTASTGCIGAP